MTKRKEKNAVALVIIDGTRYGTGSLLNNTKNDYEPLFVLGNKSLDTRWFSHQTRYDSKGDSLLNHFLFYWNYESASCNNPITEPIGKTTQGAVVVSNDKYVPINGGGASNFALLRLAEDPKYKNGTKLHYLGWDRSHTIGNNNGGVCIHHPNGDIKKIAVFSNISSDSTKYNTPTSYWVTPWQATQNGRAIMNDIKGSYGAPLLNLNKKFIGHFSGSISFNMDPMWCTSTINGQSSYMKLSVAWLNNTTDSRRRLKEWLDPLNTGAIAWNGLEGINHCVAKTVTGTYNSGTNTKIIGSPINVQNATIKRGATMELDAKTCGGSVIINSGTIMEAGANLIIK